MKKNLVKNIVLAALLAALIVVALTFFHIPSPFGRGMLHFGDAFVYLAGCLLPMPYAMAAAGLGGAMADLLTPYAIWAPATLIIKASIAALFSAKGRRLLTRRNALCTIAAAAVSLVGYYLAELLLYWGSDWKAVFIASMGENLVQAAASTALFFALTAALDGIRLKDRLLK